MAGGCAVESGAPTPMPILCKFMEMDANQPPSSMKPHETAWNRMEPHGTAVHLI